MALPGTLKKSLALTILLGLSISMTPLALANEEFAAGWQAKPLVDTSTPAKPAETQQKAATPPTQPAKPAGPSAAEIEARLKPAEPFIQDIEKNLSLTPPKGTPLIERLSTLQVVLFGEPKYQDAGQLLGKLAELFPQEAAKAQAELNKQAVSSLTPKVPSSEKAKAPKSNRQPIVQPPTQAYPPSYQSTYQPGSVASQTNKGKQPLWNRNSSSGDPFENDPFFQDNSQPQAQSKGPSMLGGLVQGLAGLALIAGSVVGSNYLNNKLGNNTINPNYNQYPYGQVPYGYPQGNVYPYGAYSGYQVPGYQNYGYGYPAYRPLLPGFTTRTVPYQSSGTFSSISPLGTPTGFGNTW